MIDPIANSIWFDEDMLHCCLQDGRVISTPISRYPLLANASKEQRDKWELIAGGEGFHWAELDEDLSVRGFLKLGL